ncbi:MULTISPECIES: hypothetical protein [Cysteiniphilum]|uniref:Uncharacterized protein n=1 Tax=Cysteiniphilum litorale TaxID=2056700 RepID=A0A8J3E954_9GAMM|nr:MULTISPECIES: hypothetical protein [Cysteiniphilum]WHN66598.1 hypothetical protein NYP54_05070 [Cysteiniphilum sp. QT6929]GGG04640.1 hypothetical protein GCM10010995_22600 [Cysteiniphilum litorale]
MKHDIQKLEQQMLSDIEEGKFKNIADDELVAFKYEVEQGSKTRQISLAIKESELEKAKARAKAQGLKYQSVFKALIHQYANGRINL